MLKHRISKTPIVGTEQKLNKGEVQVREYFDKVDNDAIDGSYGWHLDFRLILSSNARTRAVWAQSMSHLDASELHHGEGKCILDAQQACKSL